jgi:hemerythrin
MKPDSAAPGNRVFEDVHGLIRAYDRFIPYQILDLLGRGSIVDIALGDQVEKRVTIMFSDIRDFTTLSESLTPKQNFNFLNSYLSQMEPLITVNNGIIDKYIGDAIMAIYPTSADEALAGAFQMSRQLGHYNEGRKRAGYKPIDIGIGLNTGLCMVGTIGGLSRMEGTVISDAVNLASRIESLTKHYHVRLLISEHTYNALSDVEGHCIRFIDRLAVKGKKQAQTVYEVFDEDAEPQRDLKRKTLPLFEEALVNYHYRDVAAARGLLLRCLEINPDDRPARVYLGKCDAFLENGIFAGTAELDQHPAWGADFELGVSEIDVQHEELFSLTYKMIAMMEGAAPLTSILSQAEFLGEAAGRHFSAEERIMGEALYPFLESQHEQHGRFMEGFSRLMRELKTSTLPPIYLKFRMQVMLVDWLVNHTTREDRHFGLFLKNRDA